MHVTPTKTTYALLQELSALTGKAPATITRELLDEATPALEGAIEAMRMLKERPRHAMAAVDRLDLDKAMQKKPGRKPGKNQGQGAANTG
jgi:hypothetical protein